VPVLATGVTMPASTPDSQRAAGDDGVSERSTSMRTLARAIGSAATARDSASTTNTCRPAAPHALQQLPLDGRLHEVEVDEHEHLAIALDALRLDSRMSRRLDRR